MMFLDQQLAKVGFRRRADDPNEFAFPAQQKTAYCEAFKAGSTLVPAVVKAGQSVAAVAATLDVPAQSISNWVKAEQEGKCNSGRRLPMRVDHGMTFTDEPGGVFDESNHGHNAGYTLLGRMFAMGQIQGVIATVDDELGIEYKQPGFYD